MFKLMVKFDLGPSNFHHNSNIDSVSYLNQIKSILMLVIVVVLPGKRHGLLISKCELTWMMWYSS